MEVFEIFTDILTSFAGSIVGRVFIILTSVSLFVCTLRSFIYFVFPEKSCVKDSLECNESSNKITLNGKELE